MDREQIIKALECCNDDGDCSVCPYERARYGDELECTEELHADALALIKELTERNGNLDDSIACLKVELETARADTAREFIEFIEDTAEDFYPTEWHKGYNDALRDLARAFKKKYESENKMKLTNKNIHLNGEEYE